MYITYNPQILHNIHQHYIGLWAMSPTAMFMFRRFIIWSASASVRVTYPMRWKGCWGFSRGVVLPPARLYYPLFMHVAHPIKTRPSISLHVYSWVFIFCSSSHDPPVYISLHILKGSCSSWWSDACFNFQIKHRWIFIFKPSAQRWIKRKGSSKEITPLPLLDRIIPRTNWIRWKMLTSKCYKF